MAETPVKPWDETTIVGKPIPRVDAYERVSGGAVYPVDVILPNMLYGATLRCPHPHASVKKIAVGKAREMPGVRAVLTDADPEVRVAWYSASGPPGPGGRRMLSRLFDPHCRYEGEEVAAVAAESPQQAWDAVRAIQVDYETQPFVTGMEEALKPGASPVQEGGTHRKVSSRVRNTLTGRDVLRASRAADWAKSEHTLPMPAWAIRSGTCTSARMFRLKRDRHIFMPAGVGLFARRAIPRVIGRWNR